MKSRRLMVITVLLVAALAPAAQAQFSILYNFGSKAGDPLSPANSGIIAQGRDGNLYSTTPAGCTFNQGAVFKITPAGTLTAITCSLGNEFDQSGLTLSTDGNFYSAASNNGGNGTIFKVSPTGTLTTLFSLNATTTGKIPKAPPIQGLDGNYYGTLLQGGNTACVAGCGTVYKLTPSHVFTVLHDFHVTDGETPVAPLVQGTDGNFYGTTDNGGASGGCGGTVFKISPSGMFSSLFTFPCSKGANPVAPLIQGSDGNFYGTAMHGGNDLNDGVVFKITPSGVLSILHSFIDNGDGIQPFGGLVQATDGNLYGTTSNAIENSGCGTIFRINPNGTAFSTLHTFSADGSTGCHPQVTLVQHTNGILYGDTNTGGTGGHGVFFSLKAGLPPFVNLLPYSGKVGTTIEFLGQGFTSTSKVSFNGIPATRTVVSGTYLTAIVPSGATTGLATVTTSGGTLKSNRKFRVIP